MSKGMWDHYWSEKWRVGDTRWLTDGRKTGISDSAWIAMPPSRSDAKTEHFDTYAEAITFAHREATKAVAAKNQLPPRMQEPTC